MTYLPEHHHCDIGHSIMQPNSSSPVSPSRFELHYQSLFHPGRGLVFPCDARGEVELDALTEKARRNYFYARTVGGREYAMPAVVGGLSSVAAA